LGYPSHADLPKVGFVYLLGYQIPWKIGNFPYFLPRLIEVEKGEIKIDIEGKQKFTEAEISISTKVTLIETSS